MATSERTQRRDKHEREAETIALLECARELTRLAIEHPECADILNVAMVHVRWRSRSTRAREEAIIKCVSHTALTIDEICEEIFINPSRDGHRRMRATITRELERLRGLGVVAAHDRDGEPIQFDSEGRPRRTPYYSEAPPGQTPPAAAAAARDNADLGSSGARTSTGNAQRSSER